MCASAAQFSGREHDAADPELERWQTRYAAPGYLFGTAPNAFLKSQAHLLPKSGTALAIADGEGRNGVFLAEQGLDVLSVDFSALGQEKARALAKERGVTLRIEQADMSRLAVAGRRVRRGGGDLHPVRPAGRAGKNLRRHQAHAETRRATVAGGLRLEAAGIQDRRAVQCDAFIYARDCWRTLLRIFRRSISANTTAFFRRATTTPACRR